MAEDDILDYLRKKQEFIDDDYKLRVIFDFVFFDGNKITYDDISKQLDLKMTIAPITNPYKMKIFLNTNKFKNATRECITVYGTSKLSGFFPSDNCCFKTEAANVAREVKEKNFLESFETLVANTELLPNRSVILLNQDTHHTAKCEKRKSPPMTSSNKKLKRSATKSRAITDFFPIVKSASSESAPKKTDPVPIFKYKVEEILHKVRGDNVKILWIPHKHSELDPMSYIQIMLKSLVCTFMEDNSELNSLQSIKEVLKIFPDSAWSDVMKKVEFFEKVFLENSGDREFDQDEEDEDSRDSAFSEVSRDVETTND